MTTESITGTTAKDSYLEWKEWSADRFGQLTSREKRYFKWHVQRALPSANNPVVLEIGFGNGAFLTFCRYLGWNVIGVEWERELCERARNAGFLVAANLSELPSKQQFDLIVLFDVLEHISADQLVDFTRTLADHLAPDGALLLRVPNGDSPFGRHHQHGDLTHVTTFGEFKLQQLARMCQLRVVVMGESPWNAQQHEGRTARAFFRWLVRRALDRLFGFAYYGRRVDLTANLVAVLKPNRLVQ